MLIALNRLDFRRPRICPVPASPGADEALRDSPHGRQVAFGAAGPELPFAVARDALAHDTESVTA
jgi:hypothetical protein